MQTFGALRQTGVKWRREPHFANFFVTETTHRFTRIAANDFREIWTQNVNRRRHENFRNRISKFFRKEVIFPEKKLILVALGVH